ncbi:MAG TPA: FG-GAP-like repeat-containing protein [Pyrinomonadaceae bacterium]|jgi:tetratricopeptide (TPR) repeat protein
MKEKLRFLFFGLILTAGLAGVSHLYFRAETSIAAAQTADDKNLFAKREAAYRANNVGVARLEQFNHKEGAEDFRRALELAPDLKIARINLAISLFNTQDMEAARAAAKTAAEIAPESPQPFYVLGMIARNENRVEEAVANFERVIAFDAGDVGANVNLGQLLIQQRKYKESAVYFRRALDAEPYNVTAMYNLATALLRSEAREEGLQLMKRFQALRESGAATNIGLNYLEQGRYAEALTSTGAEGDLVDKTAPAIVFQPVNVGLSDVSARVPKTAPTEKNLPIDLSPRGAALFDFDNDGDLDVAQISTGITKVRLYRNNGGVFSNITPIAGDLNKIFKTDGLGIVAGDFDNDLFADLLIFGKGQPVLFRGNGKGVFQNVTLAAKIPAATMVSAAGAFVDADHDGDLDIFLGGLADNKNAALAAANQLLRNNGDGTFADVSHDAEITLPARAAAVVPTDYDNRRDVDILVVNAGEKPQLFRNLRNGSFQDVAAEVGLDRKANWTCAAAGDFNKDTYTDFFFGNSDGAGVFAVSDGRGKFVSKDAPAGTENAAAAQFIDYDNDGLLDLLVSAKQGLAIARNLGENWSKAETSIFQIKPAADGALIPARQILSGDLDGDGDLDLLGFAKNGSLQFLRNSGGTNRSEIIHLQGRVSNRTGVGAKIDLRAGSLSQKMETYAASPMPAPSEVHFGLGKREKPDAVRVIWSSGVVQAEIDFPGVGQTNTAKNFQPFKIEELDRKPSSCPYLYAWNGERFEFVTDFLGGGEMGNWQEKGVYHYPDSDEFVRLTSEQLKPKNGKYEIRVTNELEEVLFLDHLKLVAVEHDRDAEVYPNEGLGIPSAGQRILYTTRKERAPLSAVGTDGKSVLAKIEKLDRAFYDDFTHQKIRGYAETHHLTLNLDDRKGYRGRTLLLLTGWTDYAFSSDNLAASQSGKSLFLPKLQVKNRRGEWETVIDSIGVSVGRPQTIVVDLTGKFLTDSREVRIETNFKTYWDKIAVDTSAPENLKTFELKPAKAELAERGYSEEIKFGEMIAANYERVLNDNRWKYFSGRFTRTGAVGELLAGIDDVFVISKTGDELILSFDALPELPANKKYTFLLYADGYSKEMDINSGSPDAVLPLPFKGMRKYPYGADEQYPMTGEKQRLYDEYTTRTVKGFLPRIEASLLK